MEFKKTQTIYMQIADFICENILTGNWPEGDKISSVRELAATIEVNPNTVMRSYTFLQDGGVIHNKRGIGFFVSEGAAERVSQIKRKEFISDELPVLFKKMDLLNIDMTELSKLYKKTLKA